MHDFIGTPIVPGCWVAVGGRGNGPAEYGMILHRVKEVKDGKLRTSRIRVHYGDEVPKASVVNRTIQKGTKVVVVTPPDEVAGFFKRVADGTATPADHKLAGKWIHGQTEGLFT